MIKQVIIIRKDLKMRRGKEIAQGSHASCSFFASKFILGEEKALFPLTDTEWEWVNSGMTKICLQVQTEQELMDIVDKASKAGLTTYFIVDKGTTEFGGVPTLTCAAIGPDEEEKINLITKDLKLY